MIDLIKILDDTGLDTSTVAGRLFPNNGYPMAALTRILKGESFLDSQQLLTLSELTGVEICDMFTNSWRGKAQKNQIILTRGSYKAIINLEENTARLFDNDSLFYETILFSPSIRLRVFIKELDNVFENQNK